MLLASGPILVEKIKNRCQKATVFSKQTLFLKLAVGLAPNDSYWARTSDLYPVKVALSQLS